MNAKRITKATVKAALKQIDTEGLTVELDSDTVTFWFDSVKEEQETKAQAACEAICKATGVTNTSGNGSKLWVNYKREPADKGDWNDRTSAWHY